MSLDDVVMLLLEQQLQRALADGAHRVGGHGGDEHGEQLVRARHRGQALVVLGHREHLGHGVPRGCVRRVVRHQRPAHLHHVRRGRGGARQHRAHHRAVERAHDVQPPRQAQRARRVLLLLGVRVRGAGPRHGGQHALLLRVDEHEAEDAAVYCGGGGVRAGERGEGGQRGAPLLHDDALQLGQRGLGPAQHTHLQRHT